MDVGVGKGCFVDWRLMLRLDNRIIGIECDEKSAAATAHRLRRRAKVTIAHADAASYLPAYRTLFFLFDPFEGDVMASFKATAMAQFGGRTDVLFVYMRPLDVATFKDDSAWLVEEGEVPQADLDVRYRDKPSHWRFDILVPRGN